MLDLRLLHYDNFEVGTCGDKKTETFSGSLRNHAVERDGVAKDVRIRTHSSRAARVKFVFYRSVRMNVKPQINAL